MVEAYNNFEKKVFWGVMKRIHLSDITLVVAKLFYRLDFLWFY